MAAVRSDYNPAPPPPAAPPGRPAAPAPSPALEPPPGNPRFPLFDALRGIAVLAVLSTHAYELTGRVGIGVDGRAAEVLGGLGPILFFVISGFLLYRPYVAARLHGRDTPRPARFARRRALRIVPAYWVALTVLAIFPGLPGVFSSDWWRYYGFLQLYSSHTAPNGIAVAWTLCVEVSFYLTLPIWAAAIGRLQPAVQPLRAQSATRHLLAAELVPLALVAGGGAVIQVAAAHRSVSHPLGTSLAGQCTWLALGMAFGVLSTVAERDRQLARVTSALADRAGVLWCVALFACAGLMALVPRGGLFGVIAALQSPQSRLDTAARVLLTAVFCAALVLPAVFSGSRPGLPRRVLAFRPLVLLGVISYSFYLFHFTIAQVIALPHPGTHGYRGLDLLGHVGTLRELILLVATLAATAIVATASYRLVELPFLRHKG